MMRSLRRAPKLVFSLTLAVWALCAAEARAVPLIGLSGKELISFDSDAPEKITRRVRLTGVDEGVSFMYGLDFRPSNGRLYAIGVRYQLETQLYLINHATGVATLVGNLGTQIPVVDISFDPVSDELRGVSCDANLRINPDTGKLIAIDNRFFYNPRRYFDGPCVTGAAHTNNFSGTTTLYAIDADVDSLNGLARVGSVEGSPISPNTGQLFEVGRFTTTAGNTLSGIAAFDITPDNIGFVSFMHDRNLESYLYRVDLTTGRNTFLGIVGGPRAVGADAFLLFGLAALPPATVQLDTSRYSASEHEGRVSVNVTRGGDLAAPASVRFETQAIDGDNDAPCDARSTGAASPRCDFTPIGGTINFAAGQSTQTINLPIADDAYNELTETFTLALSEAQGAELGTFKTAVVEILDDDAFTSSDNPIDRAESFVRQNYHDFLSRPPDAEGLAFWTGRITACGANASCADRERVNTSMGFFLSIEFQQTGFFIHQLYRAAFGRQPSFAEFLPDTQQVGRGVVVLAHGWEDKLEANRRAFLSELVARRNFMQEFPADLTADAFVDRLFAHAALAPTAIERQAALDAYGAGDTEGRARSLRTVAENRRLAAREFNRAFVLMEYFGYLRRDPDPSGYAFWLNELDTRNSHFNMVRAFIVSEEYRQRFGR